MFEANIAILLIVCLIALVAIGVHIAIALGMTSALGIFLVTGADSYAFKVASEDWAAANLGAPVTEGSTPTVVVGQPKVISSGEAEAANIELTLDAEGTYRFNVWHISPLRPVIQVNTVD